jgi:hypothetical protein
LAPTVLTTQNDITTAVHDLRHLLPHGMSRTFPSQSKISAVTTIPRDWALFVSVHSRFDRYVMLMSKRENLISEAKARRD